MKLLLDVAELAPGMGKSMGIYNYAVNLFQELAPRLPADWTLHVACNGGCAADFATARLRVAPKATIQQHIVLPQRQPGTVARQRWLRWGAQRLARQVGATLYFTPKGFLPGWWGAPMRLKTVAVLHDLIPLWYAEQVPDQFGWLERQVVNGGLLRTARHADAVIAISQATADDVRTHVPRHAPLHVVHNGIPVTPATQGRPQAEPYLFAMASSLPHKNLRGLLQAYQAYRATCAQPLPLVICGGEDPGLPGISVVRGLSDEQLHSYYAHAEAFLFLSLIEGFGFPPLEAMAHGTPVVCSDIAVFRELTGGQAWLVDPMQAEAVASALMAATAPDARTAERSAQRRAVAAQYSWSRCAEGVLTVLQAMAPSYPRMK